MSNRAQEVFSKTYSALNSKPLYRTDSKGRKVRVFKKDAPLTIEALTTFYKNSVRATDERTALETIGYNATRYAIANGYLVPVNTFGVLAISAKAAKTYNLPKPRLLSDGPRVNWLA